MIKRIRGFHEGTRLAERDRMRIFTALAIIFVSGCTGDLVEIGSGAKGDMANTGGAGGDMAQAGGGEMGPMSVKFSPDIQMDIDTKGCTNAACHNNTTNPPQLKAMATAQADIDSNYTNFTANCNTGAPDQSNVLKTMLPGGGHAGGQMFASTTDPVYMKWLAWIQAGEPKQ